MTNTFNRFHTITASILITPALILAAPASAQSSDQMRQMLERADANGDGNITRAEFDQARAQTFARLDRNNDGYVDSSDRPRLFGDRFDQGYRMLSSLDTNGDGRVSRTELAKADAPAFIAADANGDKVLSREEIAALRPSR